MDCLNKIEATLAHGSKSHRRIAEYILRNYDKAAFMTALKLGETVGVSESTTVRFAVTIGYNGYPEMQEALRGLVRNKLTSVQRMEADSARFDENDVPRRVLASDIEMIRQTAAAWNSGVFDAVVESVLNARRLYIIGMRSSAILAQFLGYYLNMISDDVTILGAGQSDTLFEQCLHINEEDCLLGISFPRYARSTLQTMRFAKNKGATVVTLTDNAQAPPAAIAHHTLLARGDRHSFVDSLVAPLSVINALLVTLSIKRNKEFVGNFEELEKIWSTNKTYA